MLASQNLRKQTLFTNFIFEIIQIVSKAKGDNMLFLSTQEMSEEIFSYQNFLHEKFKSDFEVISSQKWMTNLHRGEIKMQ